MNATASYINSIHHLEFHVSNALQSAFWYCCNFGFRRFAFRRSEQCSEVAVRNGQVILVFKCSLKPNCEEISYEEELARHGDFVKDVAFCVDDVDALIKRINEVNPKIVLLPPRLVKDDENGSSGWIRMARVRGSAPNGSIVHTLIEKSADYSGAFLPKFCPIDDFVLNAQLAPTTFCSIDHLVEGHAENSTNNALDWYERNMAFHRFWSIDDKSVFTEYSALRASIIANGDDRRVQIVVAEPVKLERDFKGQIQEFLDHHGGHGVQHVAFSVTDICTQVERLRQRGVQFLHIPDIYYDELEERLVKSGVHVVEDLRKVRELKILLDFDENGYLLQIFTKPMQDRPTFFIEIIQRHNFNGFGAGNFKALFAAVEREQRRRLAEQTTAEDSHACNGALEKK